MRWYLMPSTRALAAVDDLGGEFDELLRVAFEVVEPTAVYEDAVDAPAGERGLVLKVGKDVREFDVALGEGLPQLELV